MTWNLFIDDERSPHEVFWADSGTLARYHEQEWEVARSLPQVAAAIKRNGKMPSFISFDHDLGQFCKTGYEIAKWLCDLDMQQWYRFPKGFDFFVHSQNPVGKKNIEAYLINYFRQRDES